jgi:hypothetical protein
MSDIKLFRLTQGQATELQDDTSDLDAMRSSASAFSPVTLPL